MTTFRIGIVVSLVVALILSPVGVSAGVQTETDATRIEYGQTFKGQITNDTVEVRYQFAGKAKELVIIGMDQDAAAGLKTPAFTVLSGQNRIIDSTKIFTLSQAIAHAVFLLPKDGDYTIVATRRGGKTGKDVGGFVLSLNNALRLTADRPVEDSASDGTAKYYAVEPSAPFSIAYVRMGGKLRPGIYITAVRNAGAQEGIAELSGQFLESGTMSVTPDPGVTYMVYVGKAFLSNSTGDVQYSLLLYQSSAKSG
jgi:hypothetical protein